MDTIKLKILNNNYADLCEIMLASFWFLYLQHSFPLNRNTTRSVSYMQFHKYMAKRTVIPRLVK